MIMSPKKLPLLLAGLALGLAALACNLPAARRSTTLPPTIPVSTEAVQNLEKNLQTAATQVVKTGKAKITFTEAQLTSALALELQSQQDMPLSEPQVYLRDGQIQLTGKVSQNGITAPMQVDLTIEANVQGGLHYQIVSAKLGPLPLPQSMVNQLSSQLDQTIAKNLSPATHNLFIESVNIADGQMTISGHTR